MLALFESRRFDGWTVYEEPKINSMKPDFIAFHPKKGIVIIEVKDYDLNSSTYLPNGYVRGTNGQRIKKNPVQQVVHYRESLLKNELRASIEFSEAFQANDAYFGCIETVVYFHNATNQQARTFCGNPTYTKIWTRKDVAYIAEPTNRLSAKTHTFAFSCDRSNFAEGNQLQRLTDDLHRVLSYSDYDLERANKVQLSNQQAKYSELQPAKQLLYKGVAGAGKTLMLTEKALQAATRGENVLILTYNITLRHYIRDMCSQQSDETNYKKAKPHLTILHFHDLLKNLLASADIERNADEEEEEQDFTAGWISQIKQYILPQHDVDFLYDTILIDEGQDFQAGWLDFLQKLYTQEGEFAVFYDPAQNLYGHGQWLEQSEERKSLGFKKKPIELKQSYRLPKKIIEKIETAKAMFHIQGEEIEVAQINEQGSFFDEIEFLNHQAIWRNEKLQQIEQVVLTLLQTNPIEDITILTTNEETGAEIVRFFQHRGARVSHVYDLQKKKSVDARRAEKWRFQGGTGRLKVCSYHSYKGWETPNVVLVLDAPSTTYREDGLIEQRDTPSLKTVQHALFIAMSRVKGKQADGSFHFTCLNYIGQYIPEFASLNEPVYTFPDW
ncbi:nuclease-related domain-containing DEAD/DEAH box helicase [Solibacillus merdavium]|uniref:NERD domain-containing protein n=1 Tax=Solibacillus merdavium TaxID=2762218 RepID=A0ABR8XM55_9BACL|nr:nuclease-related domain-containing DEAD/DEAH box helicase [Solibacillus merdavium]MBD8033034.1 NERD domain-containing protein [Solibacillus merdavium]